MKYNDYQMSIIFEKYMNFVDELPHRYTDNIKNLLYVIVPAFILKYGIENEKIILNTFRDVIVLISIKINTKVQAYYQSIPTYIDNKIATNKCIVLQNYNDNLVNLLDNLVHEFNHAVNSEVNEISFNDNEVLIRTGISFFRYDKNSLKFISKDNNYILEEILNTRETEEIIDIIHSFKTYHFDNKKINTALYLIDNHIKDNYSSDAYSLEVFFAKELIKNRTFITTLSKLRLKGSVEDITYWFDNITGMDGSFNKMINILIKTVELEKNKPNIKFFQKSWLNKIRSNYKEALSIINTFNNNCNYK